MCYVLCAIKFSMYGNWQYLTFHLSCTCKVLNKIQKKGFSYSFSLFVTLQDLIPSEIVILKTRKDKPVYTRINMKKETLI